MGGTRIGAGDKAGLATRFLVPMTKACKRAAVTFSPFRAGIAAIPPYAVQLAFGFGNPM